MLIYYKNLEVEVEPDEYDHDLYVITCVYEGSEEDAERYEDEILELAYDEMPPRHYWQEMMEVAYD